ncbi:MAG TPA: hypothetical protein VG755_36085 [Nannocystaceae bacterium]|nr:hypothetical protein [Nannocystaceae bacterium]
MLRRTTIVALVSLAGCGDVVIGTFVASGSDGSSSGEVVGPLPGGCVEEAFDGSFDENLWLTWADDDATTFVQDGALTLVPPSSPEIGTGFVWHQEVAFEFANASARVEVITPPDPSSLTELFLQVTQVEPPTGAVLSFGLFQNGVRVRGYRDDGSEAFAQPIAIPYPRWIGIRTADARVHFEVSDDGDTWTELSSFDVPGTFVGTTPLVMAWNNAGGPVTPQPVVVDALQVCAQ